MSVNESVNGLFSDPVFRQFATERPVATGVQLVVHRLLQDSLVDEVVVEHSDAQYVRVQTFSVLTDMVSHVVMGKSPSINAAFKKFGDRLGVRINSVYEKLKRVETQTSQALVRFSYRQAIAAQKEFGGVRRNDLAGYATRILDGNCIGKTEHRLKETRTHGAAPLPGKSLVVYDPRHDAVCDMFPIEDGHAQERSSLDPVIETIGRNELWSADRNFCTLKFLYSIAEAKSVFVIRKHGLLHGTVKGKLKKIGRTDNGIVYENKLVLPTYEGQTMTVRRVVIRLDTPTRDGDTEVVILSNVPAEKADGRKISELYRDRWKIETMFLHLTTALKCEINTMCYPKASLYVFACALMAYNSLTLLKGAIAAEHGRDALEELSHYYLALEISQASDGLLVALPEPRWAEVATLPSDSFVRELRSVVSFMKLSNYRKSKRGPRKPPSKRTNGSKKTHLSVKKILDARKKAL
ncbi:MAG: transposase [Planctomycetota bacterium]